MEIQSQIHQKLHLKHFRLPETLRYQTILPKRDLNFRKPDHFQEQLIHIKGNINWLSSTYFNGKKAEKIELKTKEEIINQLTASFDNVAEIIKKVTLEELSTEVEFFAGPKSKLQILNLLQDHVSHHRGQLIVYLNLNNIQPPKYSGW